MGSLLWPAILLGLGLGGFLDGIVLHQLLQWHHMLSKTYPPSTLYNLELNTLADGFFHLSTWILVVVGLAMLYRARAGLRRPGSGRMLLGGALAGWGLFNLVEGLIDHHILGLHHVRPGANELLFDLGFLLWGVVILTAGIWLHRLGTRLEKQPVEHEPGREKTIKRPSASPK